MNDSFYNMEMIYMQTRRRGNTSLLKRIAEKEDCIVVFGNTIQAVQANIRNAVSIQQARTSIAQSYEAVLFDATVFDELTTEHRRTVLQLTATKARLNELQYLWLKYKQAYMEVIMELPYSRYVQLVANPMHPMGFYRRCR